MKLAKGEKKPEVSVSKISLEIESKVAEHLAVMEKHTGISSGEIVTVALKRFIATHKDYFPNNYKS